jgi:hypothetical protein
MLVLFPLMLLLMVFSKSTNILCETPNNTEPFWVRYIKNRIEQKKNCLIFIGGPTGSGKSWSGLSICYMVDKNFGPHRIVTSMKQLMKLINSGNLTSGDAILWDEAGIDISSKSWQSLTNKMVNFLLQTFRHKRFILVFTSPYLDFIDASTRKLFHAEFLTSSIDYDKECVKLKPYLIQYNGRARKFYYKYLRVKTLVRGVAPIKYWNVPKPPKWLIEEYEQIKTKFTTNLNKDIENQLNKIDEKKEVGGKKPLTDTQRRVLELMGSFNDVRKVSKELGYSERTIYFHISQARKKNWDIKDFQPKKGGGIGKPIEI